MAITRAQQVRQMLEDGGMLVSPSTTGKRPGYRSARAQEVQGRTTKSQGISPGQAAAMFGADKASTYAGMDKGAAEATIRSEVARQRNINKLKDFKEKKPEIKVPNFPGILTAGVNFFKTPLQKFSDFTTAKNRKFFQDVIRAGRIPGLNFATLNDLTPEELEDKYQDYLKDRLSGETDAYGNKIMRDNDGRDPIPFIPPVVSQPEEQVTGYVNPLSLLTPRIAGTKFLGTEFEDDIESAADGGRIGAMGGGIMNTDVMGGLADGGMDESGRQMYFLGKLVKKATRAIKKITKSPIGKAALVGAGFGLAGMGPMANLFSSGKGLAFKQLLLGGKTLPPSMGFKSKGLLGLIKDNPIPSIFLTSLAAGAMTPKEGEGNDALAAYYAQNQLNPSQSIRGMGSEFDFYGGQRMRVADGGMPSKEPVAKKTMPLLDMDGQEMDLRAEGGFVPLGRMERADDVPARLSKNEFVFTADAVRNAGEGDIDKGAEVMYNMMKNLESGGEVSEESQGLEGAREMFQTSQRLEEVI